MNQHYLFRARRCRRSRCTIYTLWLALSVATAGPLAAQTTSAEIDERPDASIALTVAFVSNDIDRGQDLYTDRARQTNTAYGSHTGAWSFQPNLTWNTPAEGLYVDLWVSVAMYGRGDRDIDLLFQAGPGQTDLAVLTEAEQAANLVGSNGPGFYSEEVGLARSDRVVQTIGYEKDTRVGTIGFGLSVDAGANVIGKRPTTTEIFLSYALPFLPQLTFETIADINEPISYHKLAWGDALEFADGQSLDYSLGVGYGMYSKLQGVQDYTLHLQYNIYGFFVGCTISHRPTLAIFDEDDSAALNTPEWITGGSSRGDGRVADPSRQNGYWNRAVNAALQDYFQSRSLSNSYTYTPRQKLPRVIWAASLGYAVQIP